jgi:hypothetical protein
MEQMNRRPAKKNPPTNNKGKEKGKEKEKKGNCNWT